MKERNREEEESKFRGRISRWSISWRLIIQSGRAGGTFRWRWLPLVAAEHLYRIVCRSLVIVSVGMLRPSILPQTSWWAELVWRQRQVIKVNNKVSSSQLWWTAPMAVLDLHRHFCYWHLGPIRRNYVTVSETPSQAKKLKMLRNLTRAESKI